MEGPGAGNGVRWEALDYLRGLMALSILIFHFDKWNTDHWDASTLQGKLGVYGVSIFFVLSGMALMATYQNTLQGNWRSVAAFAIKRVFRIFPLLWLVTLITMLRDKEPRTLRDIFLNFSGLFGFVDPSRDIATGAWSIGCELVYYALFPLILLVTRQKKWSILALTTILAGIGLGRAFARPFWPETTAQVVWWPFYVQAWCHAFFFAAGMALVAYRVPLSRLSKIAWWVILGISTVLFTGLPVSQDPHVLVGGYSRVVLSVCAIAATAAWGFGMGNIGGIPQKILHWLGAISYALYLLHPLVYRAVKSILSFGHWSAETWLLPLAVVASFLTSHLVFIGLETPAKRLGGSLAQRIRHKLSETE